MEIWRLAKISDRSLTSRQSPVASLGLDMNINVESCARAHDCPPDSPRWRSGRGYTRGWPEYPRWQKWKTRFTLECTTWLSR